MVQISQTPFLRPRSAAWFVVSDAFWDSNLQTYWMSEVWSNRDPTVWLACGTTGIHSPTSMHFQGKTPVWEDWGVMEKEHVLTPRLEEAAL